MCMWCQIPITQLSSVSQVLWYVIYLCMSSPVVTVSFVAMCMWCHLTKFIMNFPNFLMIAYGAIIAAFSRLLQQTFWTFDVYVPGVLPQTYERISAEQHPSCDTRVLFPIHSLRDENLRFWPPAGAGLSTKISLGICCQAAAISYTKFELRRHVSRSKNHSFKKNK